MGVSAREAEERRSYGARNFTESVGKQYVVKDNKRDVKDFYNKHAALMYAASRGYSVWDRVTRRFIQPQER